MSRRHADRTIRLFKEFGAGYFELSQLTRISPREYRSIAAHIDGQKIHVNGEAIALIETNSEKVAAAVCELREKAGRESGNDGGERRVADLERRCVRLADEIAGLLKKREDLPRAAEWRTA